MKFKRLINKSKETRRKYEYYLSLGYSEHAAKVLSVVTYGDEMLVFLVKQLGRKNVVEELYAWLHERKEETPEKAIRAYYDEKHPRPEYEEERLLGCSGAGIMPCVRASSRVFSKRVAAKKAAPPVAVKENVVMCEACMEIPPWVADESDDDADSEILEGLSTDSYEPIEEKDAKNVFTSPTSTFRITTSNASMGIVFNQIRSGRSVNMDEVRIEEVLNYFDFEAEPPKDARFAIYTELMEKKGNKKILFIDAEAAKEKKEHQNIILLLDTSGSMDDDNEVTQKAIATVFSKLKAGDRISLIT